MFKDFRKLYLGVQIFKHYFEDTGLQRYPLSTKDFCNFYQFEIGNFFLVNFSIFGDLDWEGSNGDQTLKKQKKHYKILGANTSTLFRGWFIMFIIANRNFGVL